MLPHEELQMCCHSHDLCYDVCDSDKDICDLKFKKCLYRVCSAKDDQQTVLQSKACKGAAKIMYHGTVALGCKAYQDAQKQACLCLKREEL